MIIRITIILTYFFIYGNTQASEWLNFFKQAQHVTGVDAVLLFAIANVESGYGGNPHPWTVAIKGVPYRFDMSSDFSLFMKENLSRRRDMDVGIMQVNAFYHRNLAPDLRTLIHPWTNVLAAATIIKQCGYGQKPINNILICYHGKDEGYVKKVLDAKKKITARFYR